MSESVEYVFRCPECTQRIEVNASMREALIDNGCVVCGAAVSAAAFTPAGGSVGGRSTS